jgi:peptidoglycan/LPS O-acetylase OafA/YrhL
MSLLIWATTLPISAMVYAYFEKPIMDLRDHPFGSGPEEVKPAEFEGMTK